MELMKKSLFIVALLSAFVCSPAFAAGFLEFPLHCSTPLSGGVCPSSSIDYTVHGAYTANAITSVLDHSMKENPANGYYPYGTLGSGGGDGKITAFNGKSVSGAPQKVGGTCIGGTIYLHPDWDTSKRMTNNYGCNSKYYSSYDEHPGYDYVASMGTPVYAAASGYVLSTTCYKGNEIPASDSCASWGAVGINHENGYITQYFHMNTTLVSAGSYVLAGQQIGTAGDRCGGCTNMGPHLHFEVRETMVSIGPEAYPIVDPYGWVGSGSDPLYSAAYVPPENLWK